MNTKKLTLCFILFAFAAGNIQAQKKISNSLLWRISGNGLTQPSYLFGTMHLKDRRLFQFTDSVYKNIETTKGFAMEIDPNEMLDSVLSNLSKGDTTSLLRKLLDKKKYDAAAKKLEKKTGVAASKITRKTLIDLRDQWAFKVKKKDDMNAAVDMYLFDIAKRQGKWTGGIEDVSDQLNLGDELGRTVDIEKLIEDDDEDDKKKNEYLEKMIRIYTASDLQALDEMMNSKQEGDFRDIVLIKRNIKMAYRMDSLAHVRNTFFAVGAAHLGGDSGVVELLQKRGFTVEPVYSSQKIAPEKYVFTEVLVPWITYSGIDSAYTASLPGKPSDMNVAGNAMTLKVYADLGSGLIYLNGYSFLSDNELPENSYKRLINFFSGEQIKPETRDITLNGLDGREVTCAKDRYFYKIQIYVAGQKVYVMMVGAEKKDLLNSKDSERYLQSFTPNIKLAPKKQQWVKQSFKDYAFEIEFPGKLSVDMMKPGETAEGLEGVTYSMLDQPSGHYFLAIVSQTKKGFFIESDTVILNSKLNYYRQEGSKIEDLRYFNYEGFPAVSYDAAIKKEGFDGVVKVLVVSRGNRNYTLGVVSEKGKENFPDVTHFFRQFKLLPQRAVSWKNYGSESKVFSTYAPSAFDLKMPDSAALVKEGVKERPRFESYDPGLLDTWYVNADATNPYHWYKNDSSFIAEKIQEWYRDTSDLYTKGHIGDFDSLVSKKAVTNGNASGVEILTKNAAKNFHKQIRILRHGDSTYTLIAQSYKEILDSENNRRFFDDFRFADDNMPTTLLTNKTELILKDIQSSDSATRSRATDALETAPFTIADLPLLHKAYILPYAEDPDNYRTKNELLADVIIKLNDSSTTTFIQQHFSGTDSVTESRKPEMLKMLAQQKTASSFQLFKTLLLTDRPKQLPNQSLFYYLKDSSLLAQQLFPACEVLFNDSVFGPGLISVAMALADSGLVNRTIITNNAAAIISTANTQLEQLKKDREAYLPFEEEVMNALGMINTTAAVNKLNGYLKSNELYRKQMAAVALVKINQKLSPLDLNKLASSVEYRVDFYKALQKVGKESLFPVLQRTQQKFAESYLSSYANEEDETDMKFTFIKEKTATVNGKLQRFFIFKGTAAYEGSTENYAAICGPFAMDKSQPLVTKEYADIQIFYDEKFVLTKLDKQLEKFLKDLADGAKEVKPMD